VRVKIKVCPFPHRATGEEHQVFQTDALHRLQVAHSRRAFSVDAKGDTYCARACSREPAMPLTVPWSRRAQRLTALRQNLQKRRIEGRNPISNMRRLHRGRVFHMTQICKFAGDEILQASRGSDYKLGPERRLCIWAFSDTPPITSAAFGISCRVAVRTGS